MKTKYKLCVDEKGGYEIWAETNKGTFLKLPNIININIDQNISLHHAGMSLVTIQVHADNIPSDVQKAD
jgi:hypothetical protein